MKPNRPRAHLTAPSGWINDPNGLIEWQGHYHVYYQYNPFSCEWDTPYWGHAVSTDLVHWRQMPVALRPTPGGPDADGCFSGCMVDDGNGAPIAVYTGVVGADEDMRVETTCLARASEDLTRLRAHAANPVVDGPPSPEATEGFRDPFVWFEDGRWQQIVGSGSRDVGGIIYRYVSDDLLRWEYAGVFHRGVGDRHDTHDTGIMWECPQLVRGEDGDVLIISVLDRADPSRRKVVGLAGEVTPEGFVEKSRHLVDHGSAFYAPAVMRDRRGRTLLWGWITESQTPTACTRQGWAGTLTLPREVWVGPDGALRSRPAAELARLRGTPLLEAGLDLAAGERHPLTEAGAHLWLEADLRLDDADAVRIELLASPDRREHTDLVVDRRAGEVRLERGASSRSQAAETATERCAFDPSSGRVELTVVVDASTIEVFVGEEAAITSRAYPTGPTSTAAAITAEGGRACAEVACWELLAAIS